MKHGFKAKANRISINIRKQLNLGETSPLRARALTRHLRISVYTPQDIPEMSEAVTSQLTVTGKDRWSGLTIYVESPNGFQKRWIIHNGTHSPSRQESTIMHELAHIICDHKPSVIRDFGGVSFREYNDEIEQEAIHLGGCLQIPDDAIKWAVISRNMTISEIAEYYHASIDLVRFRINKSGTSNIMKKMGRVVR